MLDLGCAVGLGKFPIAAGPCFQLINPSTYNCVADSDNVCVHAVVVAVFGPIACKRLVIVLTPTSSATSWDVRLLLQGHRGVSNRLSAPASFSEARTRFVCPLGTL